MTETLSPALPDNIERQVERVLDAACDRELSLATAESCTGGLLASLLTDVEGAAHAFERGFVTYSNEAKAELLGVDPALLEDPGPVSEPVARAMAEGALARSRADLAVSVTGFAGPGGPGDTPGLVHFGLAVRGGPTRCLKKQFRETDRAGVRLAALKTALDLFEEGLAALRA
jgi:nicotinamide-nucleotide amidase